MNRYDGRLKHVQTYHFNADQMNEWVEAQISAGHYGNVSEYFRDLVRRDQDHREAAIQELRDVLNRAEASGASKRTLSGIMEAARQEARQKGSLRDHN